MKNDNEGAPIVGIRWQRWVVVGESKKPPMQIKKYVQIGDKCININYSKGAFTFIGQILKVRYLSLEYNHITTRFLI